MTITAGGYDGPARLSL